MKVTDLGEIEGPVLLFGGPYSNLQATAALIDAAAKAGISAENAICTGDLVAYCANPAETVALIRGWGCHVVAGNCERQLAANALDCGCGFEAGTTCDLLSAGWYAHADRHVTPEMRNWMADLPDVITFTVKGQRAAVIHGGVHDVARFIWPCDPVQVFQEEIDALARAGIHSDYVFSGHSGICFEIQIGTVQWVNAGVIGMPEHDGLPQTRYVTWGPEGAQFHKLRYNAQGAHDAMVGAGLTQGYHHALREGYWPSEEALPDQLRRSVLASG